MTGINNHYSGGIIPSYSPYSSPPEATPYHDAIPDDVNSSSPSEGSAAELAAEPNEILNDFEQLSKRIAVLYNLQARLEPESPVHQQLSERIEALQEKRAEAMKAFGPEVSELIPRKKPHMRAMSPLEMEIRRTSPDNASSTPVASEGNAPMNGNNVIRLRAMIKDLARLNATQSNLDPSSPMARELMDKSLELRGMIDEQMSQMTPEERTQATKGIQINEAVQQGRVESNAYATAPAVEYTQADAKPLPRGSYSTDLMNLNSEVDDLSHLNKSQVKIATFQHLMETNLAVFQQSRRLEPGSPSHQALEERLDYITHVTQQLESQMSPDELAMAKANIQFKVKAQNLIRANGGSDTPAHQESLNKIEALGQIRQSIGSASRMNGLPGSVVEKRLESLKHLEVSLLEQMTPAEKLLANSQLRQAQAEQALMDS
jgi:hypothetical protein